MTAFNADVAREKGQPGGFKSRVWRRFLEKFGHLNTQWSKDLNRFEDVFVQGIYEIFVQGYMSHPSFGQARVSLIAKVIDTGVEVSPRPVLHTNFKAAIKEAEKLRRRYKQQYKVFSCYDDDEDLTRKADINNAEAHAKRRAQAEQNRITVVNANEKAKTVKQLVESDEVIYFESMSGQLISLIITDPWFSAKKDDISLFSKNGWGIITVDGVSGERESYQNYQLVRYNVSTCRFESVEVKDLTEPPDEIAHMLYKAGMRASVVCQVFEMSTVDLFDMDK